MNVINIIGVAMALALLLPGAKWPLEKHAEEEKLKADRVIGLIGWWGSLILLGFNLGVLELWVADEHQLGVDTVDLFYFWAVIGLVLVILYDLLYVFAYRRRKPHLKWALVGIAFAHFLISGLLLGKILLLITAVAFLGARIPALFRQNRKDESNENQRENEGETK